MTNRNHINDAKNELMIEDIQLVPMYKIKHSLKLSGKQSRNN
jgi:hypothetical protein